MNFMKPPKIIMVNLISNLNIEELEGIQSLSLTFPS